MVVEGAMGVVMEAPIMAALREDISSITICKRDSQWEIAVWLRKLKQGLCINLEGWDGEGDGGGSGRVCE